MLGSQVFIGYLASYTGMGQASVACVSGCSCTNSTFDGHWETKASMSMAHGVLVGGALGRGATAASC